MTLYQIFKGDLVADFIGVEDTVADRGGAGVWDIVADQGGRGHCSIILNRHNFSK